MHKGSIDFFYYEDQPAHSLIEKKYRKQLHTLPGWLIKFIIIVNRLFFYYQRFEIVPQQIDRDISNLWEKHAPHLTFTEAEERQGLRLLRSLGVEGKWACLIVRDSAFLKKVDSKNDYSYHDYRDSEIDTYIPACLELVKRGYTVIRMGKVAEKRLSIDHPKVIDYPFHPLESDFGQFYLSSKCSLAFGASTGIMAIPQVFLRPTAVVNFVPIEYISSWCKGVVIWKHHVKNGKRMSLKEIFDSGAWQYIAAKQFSDNGVTLEDNTAAEIMDAVIELEEGVSDEVQVDFWQKFPYSISSFNQKPLHGRPVVRIGREFLKAYD